MTENSGRLPKQQKYHKLNKKRKFDESLQQKEASRSEERTQKILNQHFYYDNDKQKYFRKQEIIRNPILEGREIGNIESIENIQTDNFETPFHISKLWIESSLIYDLRDVFKNSQKRHFVKKIKQEFPFRNECLIFGELYNIMLESTKLNSNSSSRMFWRVNQYHKCIVINESNSELLNIDCSIHSESSLLIAAIKNRTSNIVSMLAVSFDKHDSIQLIKMVPKIDHSLFLSILIVQDTDLSDFVLFSTKKQLTIFSFSLQENNHRTQFKLEQQISMDIINIQQFSDSSSSSQVMILTRNYVKVYDLRNKNYRLSIHLGCYIARQMIYCPENYIVIVLTESNKMVVISMKENRILSENIFTNMRECVLLKETNGKIHFIYRKVENNLFFLTLRKEQNNWQWYKILQTNSLMSDNSLPLSCVQLEKEHQKIVLIQQNIFVANKTVSYVSGSKLLPSMSLQRDNQLFNAIQFDHCIIIHVQDMF